MDNESSIPELIIYGPTLVDIEDARVNLDALLLLVENHKAIYINMKNVDILTSDYADHFFGNAAIEFARRGAKMNISFKNKKIGYVVSAIVKEAISKSLPKTFGGSATVH